MNRNISIFGSTGSIGKNTLKILSESRDEYKITALTAKSNVELLAAQAREYNAEHAVITDESLYSELREALSGTGIIPHAGSNALAEISSIPVDWVMSAIVGADGLTPTINAIRNGSTIALANKECLVCAGSIMIDEVRKYGSKLIPVDSEHSAIFQVFEQHNRDTIAKIILTASGGPFRKFSLAQMAAVTPKQAVAHPNWSMGAKISVDSATMMNKGLEIIEAHYLFDLKNEKIDVIVHPESVIHSMVEYKDGSTLAQLGTPDMRTPIAVALTWPGRMQTSHDKLDLCKISSLNFEEPDTEKFPSLRLAREALIKGSSAQIIFNTANEVAVASFLNGDIQFLDIAGIVEEALQNNDYPTPTNIENVVDLITETRLKTVERCSSKSVNKKFIVG